jgi:hypothetical protein
MVLEGRPPGWLWACPRAAGTDRDSPVEFAATAEAATALLTTITDSGRRRQRLSTPGLKQEGSVVNMVIGRSSSLTEGR